MLLSIIAFLLFFYDDPTFSIQYSPEVGQTFYRVSDLSWELRFGNQPMKSTAEEHAKEEVLANDGKVVTTLFSVSKVASSQKQHSTAIVLNMENLVLEVKRSPLFEQLDISLKSSSPEMGPVFDAFKEQMQTHPLRFPKEPVAVGGRWTVESTSSLSVGDFSWDILETTALKLAALAEKDGHPCYQIEFKKEGVGTLGASDGQVDHLATGTIWVSRRNGVIIAEEMRMVYDFTRNTTEGIEKNSFQLGIKSKLVEQFPE